MTELKNGGVRDILIACVDGLKGFPEAIKAVFPHTEIQLCLVHLVRHGLNYVGSQSAYDSIRGTFQPTLANSRNTEFRIPSATSATDNYRCLDERVR